MVIRLCWGAPEKVIRWFSGARSLRRGEKTPNASTWDPFFNSLNGTGFFATWIMVVILVYIIHTMLILILTSRLKNLFSIFLLAALAPPGPLPMAQINMVMMIINSDGQDNGNGHYCHDHNDDQSNIDHDVSSSESSPSSSPIFLRIAILIWPSPKKH